MKLLKSIALAAVLTLGLTACLKDKSAEEVPADQTQEMPADAMPTDAAPAEEAPTAE